MSVKSLKTRNKSTNHFFNDSEGLICLICKEIVKEELNLDHDIQLSNHANGKKHQKNVRTLFKLCVPNWSGGYADIVKNLVFDVTFERNESSFVTKTGDNFACLVCRENIAQDTDPNLITKSIINHIQTDFHLINLKDDVSWVYPLDGKLAFIMFYKSEVYCSICKQSVQNNISCPLKRSFDHLKTHHKDVHKILVEQLNESFTEDKSICQPLKYLTLTDYKPPSVQLLSTQPSSSSSHRYLASQFSLNTCEYEAEECEDVVGSDDSADENDESSNGSVDICADDLICPECKEYIEVYNENADFSMDLHMQKHEPLMSVYTDSEFDYQDNVDYVCPICQEVIQIFNKNLELSIERHFEEKRHEHDRFTLTDSWDKNMFDFLSKVFDSLPDNMLAQKSVFVMDRNEIFCKLCNCIVTSSQIVPNACYALNKHVASTFHDHQYKASCQFLFMAVINYNKQIFPQENKEKQDNVFVNLCKQNPVIKTNKEFIEKRRIHYYCTVCDKYIGYSPKENTQVLNFTLHLNGERHKKLLMENIISKALKTSASVNLNQSFIEKRDGEFFCKLCEVFIKFSKTGFSLKKHFSSLLHNSELSKKVLCYVSKLNHEKLADKYKLVLKSIFIRLIYKPHEHYISHNGKYFCCIICNMSISESTITGKHVKHHIFTKKHRQNCFEVTCNESTDQTRSIGNENNVAQKRAKKILKMLSIFSPSIRKRARFIETRNGHFFCKICQINITCTCDGIHLKKHFQSVKHVS